MHYRPSLVSLSGSPRAVSRTDILVRRIAASVGEAVGARRTHLRMREIGPVLLPALTREDVGETGESFLRHVEQADLLVIGTPVYRASYTGALKHVFDLVHQHALRGRVVVLAATGANRHHGLVTEHQLRPLLSFFGAVTVPTAIYAVESDFDAQGIDSPAIEARIAAARADVLRLFSGIGAMHSTLTSAPQELVR